MGSTHCTTGLYYRGQVSHACKIKETLSSILKSNRNPRSEFGNISNKDMMSLNF